MCTPGATRCSGQQPQTCDSNGQWQATGTACRFVCSAASGACTGVCVPGAAQCNGAQPQTCDANGQWQNMGSACAGCSSCSSGACVPATGGACDDGNACTRDDTCQSGTCIGATPVTCAPLDQCHNAGTCNRTTGCSNPAKPDNMACNVDNNPCTADTCRAGVCMPGNAITCPAPSDQCHVAGTCSPTTGQCSAQTAAPGTTPCNTAPHATAAQCDGQGACKAVTCASGFVNDQGVCKIPNCMGIPCGGSNGAGGICTGADGTCAAGQHCNAGGQCICDGTSCPSGCCDTGQQCHASNSATCGIGGARCSTCPDCCTPAGQCAATWYPDGDADHRGDANAVANGTAICSLTQPSGSFVLDHTDCCDLDSNAFKGQTAWFTMPDGCGNYDYDCSGLEEPQLDQLAPSDCGDVSVTCDPTTCQASCVNSNPRNDPACATTCIVDSVGKCGGSFGDSIYFCAGFPTCTPSGTDNGIPGPQACH
jgi:hypothetical protein